MQGKNWDLIPVVESCCFFAPLQIGTVVIGAVGIFISLAAIISFATVIAILPDLIADAEDPDYAQMLTDIEVPMYVMGGIIIGLYAVNLIFNSVLIYGSHTKRVQLLRVYFWTTLALMMLDLIVAVVMCIVLPWFAGVIIFVSMILKLYYLFIVRSAIVTMYEAKNPRPPMALPPTTIAPGYVSPPEPNHSGFVVDTSARHSRIEA